MEDRWYRRPKHRRRATITASVLIVIALLITFAPTYIAHYFIADILDEFGIEHEGIKSVGISLWKREVWAGPVRFHTGDASPGRLGEVGIKMRLFPAFKKHALVEKVFIRGLDLYVEHDRDNGFSLNGVSQQQFRSQADVAESENGDDGEQGWGAGLVEFEVEDSRLIFKEQKGGTLTLVIDRFELADFQTWEPDRSGRLLLKGSVNGVKLDLTGNARPFAQHITINLDVNTQELDLNKIIEFTGPLGFERKAGIYTSNLHHEITLFDSGRLEGHTAGQVKVRGADYEQADKFSLAVEQAEIDLDTRYSYSKTDKLTIDGQLGIALDNLAAKIQGKNSFELKAMQVKVTQLSTSLDADKTLYLKANPQIDLTQGKFSGQVQLSMDALLDVLRYLQSISATKQETKQAANKTGLDEWAGEEVTLPKSDITIDKLKSNIKVVELNTTGGKVALDIEADSEASGIQNTSTERSSNASSIKSKLDSLQLRSELDKLTINMNGANHVADFNFKGPLGEGRVQKAGLSQKLGIEINGGDIIVNGSTNASIDETSLSVYKTDILPRAAVVVGAVSANLKQANFSLINQQLLWKLDAGAVVERALIEFAKDSLTSAKMQRFEITRAQADQDLNLNVDKLKIKGFDASVTRQLINGLVSGSSPTESTDQKSTEQPTKKESSTKATESLTPELKLKLFTAEGTKLRFRDEKVNPQFRLDLDIQTAEVRDVDMQNPKQQSHASLLAKLNEFTHLEVKAQADNIGPKINLSLKGKLDDLDLPPFSSYAAEFGGVDIDRGTFNTDVDVSAREGILDGVIKLNVKGLEFTTLSEADAQRLSETVGLPIDTAASLLRDSQGNIDLNLPVVGTVAEPSVNISSAITKAIGKTLKMVFPPTLIGSMLFSDNKEGAGLVFESIKFKAGTSELDKAAIKYLDELAELFKERPRLSLDICGRTTPKDFFAVTLISIEIKPDAKPAAIEQRQKLLETHSPELRELADTRTQVVRRYLINDKGLNAKQIGACRAIFDPNDSGSPRAEVRL